MKKLTILLTLILLIFSVQINSALDKETSNKYVLEGTPESPEILLSTLGIERDIPIVYGVSAEDTSYNESEISDTIIFRWKSSDDTPYRLLWDAVDADDLARYIVYWEISTDTTPPPKPGGCRIIN